MLVVGLGGLVYWWFGWETLGFKFILGECTRHFLAFVTQYLLVFSVFT